MTDEYEVWYCIRGHACVEALGCLHVITPTRIYRLLEFVRCLIK